MDQELLKRVQKEAHNYRSHEDHAVDHLQMAHAVLFDHDESTDEIRKSILAVIRKIENQPEYLTLLNVEGPLLQMIRSGRSKFRLIDQWRVGIATLTRSELLAFLTGEIPVTDSKGKSIRYTDFSIDCKPTAKALDQFIFETKD